jgi:beta-galactosidase
VQFEQACHISYKDIPKNYNSDIENPMYADYKECEDYLTNSPKRPLIQCEYAHAMGQSIGSFKEYWDLVRKYPNYQGGFIWDFVDQALARRDANGVTYTYGGCYNDFDYSDESFCCNGFISAQRKPHTSAWEVKHQYQNIWTSPKNLEAGEVEVYNEYFFRDLSAYRLEWTLTADGKSALSGVVEDLEVAPQERKSVKLGYDAADVAQLKGEVLLTVRFVLKSAESLLEPGHEVAFNQMTLREWDAEAAYAEATAPAKGEALRICRDSRTVYGHDFSLTFAGQGWLEDFTLRGRKMIAEPLKPMFYRPMTENDYGVRKRARNAHIYHSHKALRNPRYVMTMFLMEPKGDNVEVYTEYRIDEIGATAVLVYNISPDGMVAVTEKFRPNKSYALNITSMLRVGVALAMPDTYDNIEFYGAGPYESYCDRKSGNKVGVYKQSVDEQFCMTYVRPQESGSHCDLRWWRVTDSTGSGLEVRSNILFAASAIPYPMSQIDIHSSDYRKFPSLLEKTGKTYVNIDMAQAGLICEDSWGAVQLPQYKIPYDKHTFEFVLKPLR